MVASQDDVGEDGALDTAVDGADFLAGDVDDLGSVILEEAAEHREVAT